MLRVGVLGVGEISGTHIPAWKRIEEAELCALCDIRPEQMEAYSGLSHYTDAKEMLDKENLDILDICLPTYLHAEYAALAMERGIHVICEKPVSLHKKDAARLYETAAKNQVRFMVAQVLRFWPEYLYLKDAYDSGRYGKLLSGVMQRLGTRPGWSWENWMTDEKRSGLVPFDLHIHDVDFMVYAFGRPNKSTAFRSKCDTQDYLHAIYEYDGFFISAEASWYASPYPFQASFRFQFERAVIANEAGRLMVYEKDGRTFQAGDDEQQSGTINLPQTDGYYNEIRYFTDCVLAGRDADTVKQEELETVLDLLTAL